jgi:transcriptional regulator with XRE-family HTH domain
MTTATAVEKPKPKIRSRRESPSQEVAQLIAKRKRRDQDNGLRQRLVTGDARYDMLGRLCAQRRAKEGLSLRDVAREAGMSTSTLSRIENGGTTPDAKQLNALSCWLGVSLDRVFDPVVEDVPQQVKSLILSDPKLDAGQQEALCTIFTVLYQQMANQ